jgi:hypothetical protein
MTAQAQPQDPSTNPLTPAELDSFSEQAKNRIEMLEQYIQTIADKERPREEREEAIRMATKLFIDGATMQVSRRNHSTSKPIPIGTYFRRLYGLPYKKVKVTFFKAARLSDWQLQPDGSYQGIGHYFQRTDIIGDNGRPVLTGDMVRKKIDVDLRRREDPFYKEHHWMILFDNVTVEATGKLAEK